MPAQPDPTADDTAVLPTIEGPPLVRPYVPAPTFEHEPQGPAMTQGAAATQLMHPIPAAPPIPPQPAQAPPTAPVGGPTVPPQAMTMAMPPVPPAPAGEEPFAEELFAQAPAEHEPELGIFDFHGATEHREGGRADRRNQQQAQDSRRRTLIIAAGVGVAAIGAGLALLVSPSDSGSGDGNGKTDQALPTVTGSLWDPSPGDPSPSAEPSSAGATQSSAPKPATSHPVAKAPATSATTATTKPAPTTPPPAPAPPPPATPTVRTLKPGDTGPDVGQMQQLLLTACFDQQITNTFDQQTERNLQKYQRRAGLMSEYGVYGPQTRTQLTNDAANPNC